MKSPFTIDFCKVKHKLHVLLPKERIRLQKQSNKYKANIQQCNQSIQCPVCKIHAWYSGSQRSWTIPLPGSSVCVKHSSSQARSTPPLLLLLVVVCSLGVFIATSMHHHQWNPGLHDSFNSVVSTAMEAAYSQRNYPGNICQIDVIPKSQRFSDKILNARYGEPLLIVSHRSPRERENYRLLPLPLVAFQNIEVWLYSWIYHILQR